MVPEMARVLYCYKISDVVCETGTWGCALSRLAVPALAQGTAAFRHFDFDIAARYGMMLGIATAGPRSIVYSFRSLSVRTQAGNHT